MPRRRMPAGDGDLRLSPAGGIGRRHGAVVNIAGDDDCVDLLGARQVDELVARVGLLIQ